MYLIRKFVQDAEMMRPYLDVMYDGVVISYLDNNIISRLGRKDSVNKYQIAVKFPTLKRNTSSGYFRKYGFSFINPVNRGKFEFGFGSRVKQRYLNRKINHYTTQTATISLNDQSLGKSSSFHFPSSKENLKISLTYLGKNNRNLSPKLKQRINNINLTFNC